jgi:ATP-dependent DNA helicase RecG
MSDETIARLIEGGESYRCEFKRELSSKGDGKDKICQTICAFANDLKGAEEFGLIVLGVNDDGTPSNIAITDELELKIQSVRGEGKINPLPSFSTQKRVYRGSLVLCIEVAPAVSPPVRFDGRIWVRPGNATLIASLEDERRLSEKRRHKDQPDDTQVLTHLRMADLDLNYFRSSYLVQAFAADILAANGRSVEQQLSSTKMIGDVRNAHPTVLGMVCLGLSPADAIPGAYVQFVRYNGDDVTGAVVDEKAIHGHVSDVIAQTEAKFSAHNQVAVDFTSQDKEARSHRYPRVAFEQMFRNAVMHRAYLGSSAPIRVYWFNDRIEIMNPGGPVGMSLEEFGRPGITGYRNPNLAGALKDLGYVQKYGAGISVARKALHDNGNPDLALQPTANFVTVVMYQKQSKLSP